MTKEQYINPECEKFTISGVDYYTHPSFYPIGVSMDAKVINVKTLNFKKLTAPKYAITVKKYIGQHTFSLLRLLAIVFVPNTEGFKRAERKFSGNAEVSIENIVWTRRESK